MAAKRRTHKESRRAPDAPPRADTGDRSPGAELRAAASRPTAPGAAPDAPPRAAGDPAVTAVIGLGGSAGALESFKVFFEAMPPDSGAAFVVIQHLSPTHESLLPEILAQRTRMRVVQARNGTPVEANCVYVIPPNQDLGIRDSILYLAESVKHGGIRMPIDFFFRSLAEDRQERAVCILFSGAGSDGTLGVRAIRGAGGLTLAQDPQTAQYGDMPRSAIATALVDYILPPDRMPEAIRDYLRQPYVRGGEPAAVLDAEEKSGGLNAILAIVLNQTGCDFRCYKKSTLLRRIERRMGLRHLADVARYSALLGQDVGEVNQLLKDLLINVTAFFRDSEAFEELKRKALAPLVAARQTGEPLRAWVAGCASGEEAYSLVMLLLEVMAATHSHCPVQVFATDIDKEALQFARQGVYPESIVADVGSDRLARFFVRKEQGYQIGEALRDAVVFAAQNLITDPPFSKMDLIVCRNLLIYLEADTQAKLMPLFNFALNPGGYLFLGKSEGVSGQNDLFSLVSKTARLYRRATPARPIVLDSPIVPGRKRVLPITGARDQPAAALYADAIRQALLSHFTASVVLVDRKGHILQFHGQTGKYLNLPTAEPNLNLLDIAKEGLSLKLRAALHTALDEGKTVVLDGVALTREAGAPSVHVTVAPMARRSAGPAADTGLASAAASPPLAPGAGGGGAESLLAVIFEEGPRPPHRAGKRPPSGADATVVRRLEDELRVAQQDLQSTIEELQASNEELRISNEEVVSTNEELQSTNEELETSKEELQSVNEELITVNLQLQEKVEQLGTANSDMANLLDATQIATLFLDGALRIKFFTPATTRVLKLIPADMGRPIGDLALHFMDHDLMADIRTVSQTGASLERDARTADGACYRVRIMPYYAPQGRVDGVVVTCDDITRLRQAEEQTRRLATVVSDSNDAILLLDLQGQIRTWNRGAQELYGWSEAEALRMNIRDLAPADRADEMPDLIRRLLAGENVAPFETRRHAKDGRGLDIWLTATAVRDDTRRIVAIATTGQDVTARKQAEAALKEANETLEQRVAERTAALTTSEERYRTLFETMTEGFVLAEIICDATGTPCDLRYLAANPAIESHTGLKAAHFIGRTTHAMFPQAEPVWFERLGHAALTGEPAHFEAFFGPLGRWFEVSAYRTEPGRIAIMFFDITGRKQAEAQLQRSAHEKEVLLKEIHHRVKNNLQVISSMVSLQADTLADPALRGVFSDVQDRVRTMALVHEKLYQSENLAAVAFADYAHGLLKYLWRAHGALAAGVSLKLALEPVTLPVDRAVPCGLILNELASNALKHAFRDRDKGEVTVALSRTAAGAVRLSVSDNGLGLPAGLDWRQAQTLGLRLVQMLGDQLGGSVEVNSDEGKTEFCVTFNVEDETR